MKLKVGKIRNGCLSVLRVEESDRWHAARTGLSHPTIGELRKFIDGNNLTEDSLKKLSNEALYALYYPNQRVASDKELPDFFTWRKELAKKGVTFQKLWGKYFKKYGIRAYARPYLNTLYNKWAEKLDVSIRLQSKFGAEIQVDFCGLKIPYVVNGKKYFAEVFVGILPASGLIFVSACASQKIEDFINCHIKMFAYFGGVMEVLKPDQLRSAVSQPGLIPVIHPIYKNMGNHYGIFIAPARPRHPKDKAAVEVGVKVVTTHIISELRRQMFTSIDEINIAIPSLLEELNNKQTESFPTGRRVFFEENERQFLKPLPKFPFEFMQQTVPKKVQNGCFKLEGHYYSVPHQYNFQHVYARYNENHVHIYDGDDLLLAEHKRSHMVNGTSTHPDHVPEKFKGQFFRDIETYRDWAKTVGPAILQVVEKLYEQKRDIAEDAASACDYLKRLVRRHGAEAVDIACGEVLSLGQTVSVDNIRVFIPETRVNEAETSRVMIPRHNNARGEDYFKGLNRGH